MSQVDRESPLTGAYYWMLRPGPAGIAWDLATCHDLGVWDGVSHREFWPHVLQRLAIAWGQDVEALKHRLRDHHAGLPRGRVTHPHSGAVVIHGADAPAAVPDWLDVVRARFRLAGVAAIPEATDHEGMLAADLRAVRSALGLTWI